MTICCPCCSAKIQIICMCCLLASFSSLVVNKGASYWISPFWGEIYHFFSPTITKKIATSPWYLCPQLWSVCKDSLELRSRSGEVAHWSPCIAVIGGYWWWGAPLSHLSCGTSFFPALLSSLFAECSGGGGELRAVSRPSDKGVRSATVSGWDGSVVGTCA